MKANKALKKTFNANVKILTKNAVKTIRLACSEGNYIAEVDLLEDDLKSRPTFKINQKLIDNLKELGYRIGSQNKAKGKYFVNVFWDEPELNKEDFTNS
jgi:RNase P/RNase MRP subunit p30